ncbi:MAG TPA: dihydrofolate reductase family protein [Actinomycetes bacterium]|nr:dihydrofolate reductase family protein [Actinomycetes bacterium]
MAQLIISCEMTIDGVIDSTDSWFIGAGEHEDASFDQLKAADAMVLGRKTFLGLAEVWPSITDDRGFATQVNAMPKYVASTTLTEPLDWNGSLIKGDVATSLAELKRQHTGNLVSYGCGTFARWLVEHGLADEIRLGVHPTVFGRGERPFGDGPPLRMELLSTTMYRSGVATLTYRPVPEH